MKNSSNKTQTIRRFWKTCAILCLMLVIACITAHARIMHVTL